MANRNKCRITKSNLHLLFNLLFIYIEIFLINAKEVITVHYLIVKFCHKIKYLAKIWQWVNNYISISSFSTNFSPASLKLSGTTTTSTIFSSV